MNHDRVVRGCVGSEHIVQLFDTPEALAEAVAGFVHEGYTSGETVLVVARTRHWTAAMPHLQQRLGCPLDVVIETGRLTVVDAADALRRFMRRGRPSVELFEEQIAALIDRLTEGGARRLRIYAEMVDILAEERNLPAAREVEGLWNIVALRYPITLLCGYGAAQFIDPETRPGLDAICTAHTHVNPSEPATLSGWLLASTATVLPDADETPTAPWHIDAKCDA